VFCFSLWENTLFASEECEVYHSYDFLPNAKHLSVVGKSVWADILGEAACSQT